MSNEMIRLAGEQSEHIREGPAHPEGEMELKDGE